MAPTRSGRTVFLAIGVFVVAAAAAVPRAAGLVPGTGAPLEQTSDDFEKGARTYHPRPPATPGEGPRQRGRSAPAGAQPDGRVRTGLLVAECGGPGLAAAVGAVGG